MAETKRLVEFVQQYAEDHYEEGGWDVIVECWDFDMIASTLGPRTRTEAGALKKMALAVGIYADRQADARNSAF